MSVTSFKTNGLWICLPWRRPNVHSVGSDGEEGPDDGTNHVHPEHSFSQDLHSSGFPGLHLH